ncbi:MAG: hypothetical protein Q7T56_12190 [Nocardioidaceae bacterium]|nr:hypothetical protein [Nocardioidaceae bacterium]
MSGTRAALRDAVAVVLEGLALCGRHLPVLLCLFLAGAAVRNGALWAAVELSGVNGTLGGFVLPLAPLGSLTALILMLRVAGSSLQHTTAPEQDRTGRRSARYLPLLASTLVPFLAVYAAQGYLRADAREYVNAATNDELALSARAFYGVASDVDRTSIGQGAFLVGLVVVALALRFGIDRFDLASRSSGFGLLAAYVEVLWLLVLATQLSNYQERVWAWVGDRTVVDWVQDRWEGVLSVVGPLAEPLAAVAGAVGGFLGSADAVVILPVAWLTVGAVVLGQRLDAPERERRARPWTRHVERVPTRVRGWGHEVTADFRGRFEGFFSGLRLLVVGGLVPMLLFCVVFLLSRQAGWLVGEVVRLVTGPQEQSTGLAFAPWVDVATSAAETVLLVGLLAAAIDRVVGRARRREDDAQSMGSSA